MLRSIMAAVVVLALAITAMLVVDTATASAPEEATYPAGSVCRLEYDPRGGGNDDVVTLVGNGIPTFTIRFHNGRWDQISFHDAVIPVDGKVSWKPCPIIVYPAPR